ncbi:hypothetical protein [Spirosoma sordidisoli]|uniref:Outer membrane protein beta-barrel domain-containing protein n=1 Tax=Spirosoma sordidisoli TaxID=2502893 RepID=A0A4Q2UH90_9BACT|nr:hypothetical protein [Spirosoma sordidisoli]RYC68747.1 hypothetical protein EQG79_15075 [Spirosoma sordidisoli]
MMKRYLMYILFGLAVLPAYSQGITDYYRLPDRVHQYDRLLLKYGGPTVRDRWYVALDGFLTTNRAQLDNSFGGLIESDRIIRAGMGGAIGWSHRERWAVEAGYARMPIQTQVSISNASYPINFRYQTIGDAFMLRGKRRVLSTSGPWLRSGFWLSGGIWVLPNSGQQEGRFSLLGYRYRGRSETPDTLRLVSNTNAASRPTAVAELGAEYNVRLSNSLDLGFSVRKRWGLNPALTTDVRYTVNQSAPQEAQLISRGSGMNYGLTLRYTLAIRRTVPDVLDVQGKPRIR